MIQEHILLIAAIDPDQAPALNYKAWLGVRNNVSKKNKHYANWCFARDDQSNTCAPVLIVNVGGDNVIGTPSQRIVG